MYRNLGMLLILLIIGLFLFAPSTCNGITYYSGVKGCSSGSP